MEKFRVEGNCFVPVDSCVALQNRWNSERGKSRKMDQFWLSSADCSDSSGWARNERWNWSRCCGLRLGLTASSASDSSSSSKTWGACGPCREPGPRRNAPGLGRKSKSSSVGFWGRWRMPGVRGPSFRLTSGSADTSACGRDRACPPRAAGLSRCFVVGVTTTSSSATTSSGSSAWTGAEASVVVLELIPGIRCLGGVRRKRAALGFLGNAGSSCDEAAASGAADATATTWSTRLAATGAASTESSGSSVLGTSGSSVGAMVVVVVVVVLTTWGRAAAFIFGFRVGGLVGGAVGASSSSSCQQQIDSSSRRLKVGLGWDLSPDSSRTPRALVW